MNLMNLLQNTEIKQYKKIINIKMIKKFDQFVNESTTNKGKGVGGDTDLFPSAPVKQVKNRAIPTMDFLRVGKHIHTKKIDGFIDSIQNESIYITDRMSGEIKKYTLKEVLRELTRPKEEENWGKRPTVQGFEGTPAWATKQKIYEGVEQKKIQQIHNDTEQENELGYKEEEPLDTTTQQKPHYFDDKEVLDPDEEKEVIKEDYDPWEPERQYEDDPDPNEIGTLEEEETEQHEEEIELGTEEEDEPEPATQNKLLYGTEDNPEGLLNKGNRREMPNESWVKYWESFNQKQVKLVTEDLDEDDEQEDEVRIVRGTEDNPLPDKRRPKIESYD